MKSAYWTRLLKNKKRYYFSLLNFDKNSVAMSKNQFTRNEIYDLVWQEPLTTIAKKLNVPASSIRKACKQMAIPLPVVGYWMKKQFGKSVVVIPLDENYKGRNIVSLIPIPGSESVVIPIESPIKIRQNKIEADKGINLKIPERLHNPDPLIVQYKQNLILRKQKDYRYENGYENHLNINVTSNQEKRALQIMDTLIKALKSRQDDVKVISRETIFIVKEEKFTVSLREKNKRVKIENSKYSWNSWELKPTGILVFKIDGYYWIFRIK